MFQRICLALGLVAACFLTLCDVTSGCPEATGWYRASTTNLCYRGLSLESLNYTDAQKKCNSLRSNLFQLLPGTTLTQYSNLLDELFDYRNTSEFRPQSWIGITDRAKKGSLVFLNGLPLLDVSPDPYIACPGLQPNCETNRCMYLFLERRGASPYQLFKGDCSRQYPIICYAPIGGTDKFDKVPALGGSATTTASLAVLTVTSCMVSVLRSLA